MVRSRVCEVFACYGDESRFKVDGKLCRLEQTLFTQSHYLTIFANDTMGNMGISQAINFTIAPTIAVKSNPFPIAPATVTLPLVLVLVIAASLLFYFKRCRRVQNNHVLGVF